MSETIQFGNLTISITSDGKVSTYTFKGEVDEFFRQKDVPRLKAPDIQLVLEGITHFNSCGIREWVYLVRDFAKIGQLTFKRCSVAMVDQINMVPDSISGGEVESFFAPYACDEHGEMTLLIDMKTMYQDIAQRRPPEMKCAHCAKQLEFDALPGSYFLFCSSEVSKAS
ncbi:MAG: hypothetical protein NTV34_17110 [Proteobacteria bacterium]|nr:hypothetical protein [Pseudomonadota bacterium]